MARLTFERDPGLAALAICQSVSLGCTRYDDPGSMVGFADMDVRGARPAPDDCGAEAVPSPASGSTRADGAGADAARGAATGASGAEGVGAKTGGSSRTVYSRNRRPRGQLASTSMV